MVQKLSDAELVTAHIEKLDKQNPEIITYLRTVIMSSGYEIGEQIKWNSPSFYFTGEMKPFDPKEYKRDIVVINLHRDKILLVFPTGAKIENPDLGRNTPDGRKIVEIANLEDAKAKSNQLQAAIKDWIAKVEV